MTRIATILRLSITSTLLSFATGCPDDPGGSGTATATGSSSSSTTGTGSTGSSGGSGGTTTTTTGPSDSAACSDPSGGVQAGFDCSQDEDCCIGAHPSNTVHPDLACPGDRYPNDVECITGQCVNHGCDLMQNDCPGDELTCLQIGGENLCVEPCDPQADPEDRDRDCYDNGEASASLRTYCTGEDDSGSNNYCTFSPT